jgi:hypothetical protein
MSSPASKRTARRKAAQTETGKLKAQIRQAQEEAGQARMAVLNMRQMYRQAEQEILTLRGQLKNAETMAAAIMYSTENYTVVVTPEDMNNLSIEYTHIETVPNPAGEGTLVALVPAEDVEYEEDEDGESEAGTAAEEEG